MKSKLTCTHFLKFYRAPYITINKHCCRKMRLSPPPNALSSRDPYNRMVKQTEDTVWVKTARVRTASKCTKNCSLPNSKNYPWLVLSHPGPLRDNISTSDSTAESAGQQEEQESRTSQYFGEGEGKMLAYACFESVCGAIASDHLGFGNLL